MNINCRGSKSGFWPEAEHLFALAATGGSPEVLGLLPLSFQCLEGNCDIVWDRPEGTKA